MPVTSNIDSFNALSAKQAREVQQTVDKGVQEAATEAVAKIKDFWPSRSGTSREAWEVKGKGSQASVENDVPYVPYINKGAAAARAEAIIEDEGKRLAEKLETETTRALTSGT